MEKVLITGGTGFIGSRLAEFLCRRGNIKIRILVRDWRTAAQAARFPVEFRPGDMTDLDAVKSALEGCDTVFHCAYDFKGTWREIKRNNLKGARNVAESAASNGARVVHVSSIDVFGLTGSAILDESTPKKAIRGDSYSQTKLAIEQLLLRARHEQGLRLTVVYPSIVFGPYATTWTVNPVRKMKQWRIPLLNQGSGICNAVYIDDVVQGLVLAAESEKAEGLDIFLSGPDAITWKEFYGFYEKMLGQSGTVEISMNDLRVLERQSWTSASMGAMLKLLMDPVFREKLGSIPAIARLYEKIFRFLPSSWRARIARGLLTRTRRLEKRTDNTEFEKPILIGDLRRLPLYSMQARVSCEKARRVLGFEPKVSVAEGMKRTKQFLLWARLLPTGRMEATGV